MGYTVPSKDFEESLRISYAASPKSFGRYFIKPNLLILSEYASMMGVDSPHAACYMILNGLSVPPPCPGCGTPRVFERLCRGFHETCLGKECKDKTRLSRAEATTLARTGETHHWKTSASKEKSRTTMMERYGVDHNSKGPLREAYNLTMMERYGVSSPLKNPEILARRNATTMTRHGSLNFLHGATAMATMRARYGIDVDNVMQVPAVASLCAERSSLAKRADMLRKLACEHLTLVSEDHRRYRITVSCDLCNRSFDLGRGVFMARHRNKIKSCWSCNPESAPMQGSVGEREMAEFLSSVYGGRIVRRDRSSAPGFELDVVLPDAGLAVEFNGLYWHSEAYLEPDYHVRKSAAARAAGLNLFHVWEDSWRTRGDVVRSMLAGRLGLSRRVGARTCQVYEPSVTDRRSFFVANHLDGDVSARVCYALMNGGLPVAMASFGPSRFDRSCQWELLRFASVAGVVVSGGFSRLLRAFESAHKPTSVCSYRKLDLGAGGSAYRGAGFVLAGVTRPNYHYVDHGTRVSRLGFTKKRLVASGHDPSLTEREIMSSLGYLRVYDCGSEVYRKLYDKGIHTP